MAEPVLASQVRAGDVILTGRGHRTRILDARAGTGRHAGLIHFTIRFEDIPYVDDDADDYYAHPNQTLALTERPTD